MANSTQKTALVTGANKGIGRDTARLLAARGFHVYLGARNSKTGHEAVEALSGEGGRVTFLALDVANPESVLSAAAVFAKTTDALDVLVNNAGILFKEDISFLGNSDDLYREMLETNALGPLRVARAFLPFLEKSAEPRIINVSSGGGQLTGGAEGWSPAYCLSKTTMNGVTSQLAKALPKFAVNSVCPGWVHSDMGGPSAPRTLAQGADTIVWLASEAPQDYTFKFLRDREELPW